MSSTGLREEKLLDKPDLIRRGFEFYCRKDITEGRVFADLHLHDAIEFLYCTKGSILASIDDEVLEIGEGCLAMCRSRGIHTMQMGDSSENTLYTLKIQPKLIRQLSPKNLSSKIMYRFSAYSSYSKKLWDRESIENSEIKKIFEKLISDYQNPSSMIEVSMLSSIIALVFEVLTEKDCQANEQSEVTEQIYESIAYINENFADDITANDVANEVHMSYSYFAKVFKEATGKTFKEYLNITRLNEAEYMLVSTNIAVSEIALKCGYNNISYFIATYKKYKGKTPLDERKNKGRDEKE